MHLRDVRIYLDAQKHIDSCGIIVAVPSNKSYVSVSNTVLARVAKLVDARDLKSLGLMAVPVRLRARAPSFEYSDMTDLKYHSIRVSNQ